MRTSQHPSSSTSSAPTTYDEPPWTGWIETTGDALLILEAARRGLIPRVTRRLVYSESQMIKSGSVFVFDENESGIKRWTDGLSWSPRQILGNFSLYREAEKCGPGQKGSGAARSQQDEGLEGGGSGSTGRGSLEPTSLIQPPSELSDDQRLSVGSPGLKIDGLTKKTFFLRIEGVAQHVISYYRVEDVENGHLRSPSSLPELASLDISPDFLDKVHFRRPLKIEIGLDGVPRYRGEADEVDTTASSAFVLRSRSNGLPNHTTKRPRGRSTVSGRKRGKGRVVNGGSPPPTAPNTVPPTAQVAANPNMATSLSLPEDLRREPWMLSGSMVNSNDPVFLILQQIICHEKGSGLPGESLVWMRDLLASHEGSVLQDLADFIQSQLDFPSYLHSLSSKLKLSRRAFDRRCLRVLRHLSNNHHILPKSLTIADIRQHGQYPVAGGGFAVSATVFSIPFSGTCARIYGGGF